MDYESGPAWSKQLAEKQAQIEKLRREVQDIQAYLIERYATETISEEMVIDGITFTPSKHRGKSGWEFTNNGELGVDVRDISVEYMGECQWHCHAIFDTPQVPDSPPYQSRFQAGTDPITLLTEAVSWAKTQGLL